MYTIQKVSSSNIYPSLLAVWRSAVQATHHFLSQADFDTLQRDIPALYFPMVDLYYIHGETQTPAAFMGISGDKLEMLFVGADWREKGLGSVLLSHAVEKLGVTKVDVNEQNEQAVGFYKHYGFEVVGRTACDGQGRPYPILEMERREMVKVER